MRRMPNIAQEGLEAKQLSVVQSLSRLLGSEQGAQNLSTVKAYRIRVD